MSNPSHPFRYAARPRRSTALAVLGIVLTLIGGLAMAAGIGLIAVFGSDSALDSGSQRVSTSSAAVVTDINLIQHTEGVATITGWPTLHLQANGGNESGVFIGVGPAAEVERYLSDTTFDRVTDLTVTPFQFAVTRHPGPASAAPPADQKFWLAASVSRTTAELDWKVQDGEYRMVIMNADGSLNVITQARVELTLPHAFQVSIIAIGSGVLVLTTGIAALVVAITRGRRSMVPPAAWS